jgi:hypothetical protein
MSQSLSFYHVHQAQVILIITPQKLKVEASHE